jgi:hypothetical protein
LQFLLQAASLETFGYTLIYSDMKVVQFKKVKIVSSITKQEKGNAV